MSSSLTSPGLAQQVWIYASSRLLPLAVALLMANVLYRLFFHPLARIPGPWLARFTSLWTLYHSYVGDEATLISCHHFPDSKIHNPVVRVGPNEVTISDGAALAPIYSEKGGFKKADYYGNFDIDGFPSLFSQTDKDSRAPRAKAVVGMFSTKSLKDGEERLGGCVKDFVGRFQREKEAARKTGKEVNVLNLARSLAVDVVTAYLFKRSYGGLEEDVYTGEKDVEKAKSEQMSASEFVNAFVGVGRFFYLPNWSFVLLEKLSEYLFESPETVESMSKVDRFVKSVVNSADAQGADSETYQGRMLKAGIIPEEVVAQCKDLMFAGTDSSGMNLSTFCWQLAKNPAVYAKLKQELLSSSTQTPKDDNLSNTPYLRACIRETLRLSMANPTRLPRIVPASGWTFHSSVNDRTYHFPAGTIVSCQLHSLHHNPFVYEDPYKFAPERWVETETYRPSEAMNRDTIPFSLGSRQCIARNLAMTELNMACAAVVECGVLDGARAVGEKIEILEWFNSKVPHERIDIRWD